MLSRLPTGARVFLIISAALLPLALIALAATLQTTRTADIEARARLRVGLSESARAIAIELVGDMNALRAAQQALAIDPNDAPACARARGVFAQQFAAGTRFSITDPAGRILCGEPLGIEPPIAENERRIASQFVGDGLILSTSNDKARATAFFPTSLLASAGRPSGFPSEYGLSLHNDNGQLTLARLSETTALSRIESAATPIGIGSLIIEMSARGAPITSPLVVSMLLPLIMWAAAAGITWFVVDRLLIRPLRRLRSGVEAYAPGTDPAPIDYGSVPAQEIRQLGDTFQEITRTVLAHEAGLAEGLVRQTKLTREVHHRVKNNLQVIASLINFHARGATSAEAIAAYASIQRRVDALAVVHRYHFAELEENRGVELRSVIGELASGIRASAPEHAQKFGVVLDVEPLLVSQDTAVAIAFLITELIELAMATNPETQVRVSLRAIESESATGALRVVSPALVQSDVLETKLTERYGRVITGLARQLRKPLHHDPLTGGYEIEVPVLGRA